MSKRTVHTWVYSLRGLPCTVELWTRKTYYRCRLTANTHMCEHGVPHFHTYEAEIDPVEFRKDGPVARGELVAMVFMAAKHGLEQSVDGDSSEEARPSGLEVN